MRNSYIKMILTSVLFTNLLLVSASIEGVCEISKKVTCYDEDATTQKNLIFYDVNPPEGFNLRRDVYMRFAIMLAEARAVRDTFTWHLVLPPWYDIYHWQSGYNEPDHKNWETFFDLKSLKAYAPVLEMHEVFTQRKYSEKIQIDTVYVLQNYENTFENGVFEEKWDITGPCEYDGSYWGYHNITANEVICVKFQGKISQLWKVMATHLEDKSVMFAHGEIPLHDTYGTKSYWDCRKSMKFNSNLVKAAEVYMSEQLKCETKKCPNYVAIHWRRQDFVRYRSEDVPSITGTVQQVQRAMKRNRLKTKMVFVASDAPDLELQKLEKEFKKLGYSAYFYTQSEKDSNEFFAGELAIIEQIICSRSAYFIGTHDSTFSFRIQEEREILGFDSSTSFNRLCPDQGTCQSPSKWTIIH